MSDKNKGAKKRRGMALCLIKAVVSSYAVTACLLLILAFILFKCKPDEKQTGALVMAIYLKSTLTSGYIAGKCAETRKFAWGLLSGLLYYACLSAISYLALDPPGIGVKSALSAFLTCIAGGTAGGMASAATARKRGV